MTEPAPIPQTAKPVSRKYLWPTPTGIILAVVALVIAKLLGQQAFLSVHALLEIGLVISMLASVIYSIRLSGKGKALAPRWVFFLNLIFGPLILAIIAISTIFSFVTGG